MACCRRGGGSGCRRLGVCRLLLLVTAAWQAGLFLEALQTRHLQSAASAQQRQKRGLNNVSAAVWPIVARLDSAGPGVSWTSSFPEPAPAVDWWRLVRTHVGPAFVYSAFFDPRGPGPPKVRIIAALPSRFRLRPFYCDLKRESGVKSRVPGKHRPIRENWGLPYTASFIVCELERKVLDLPLFVSLGDPKRNITSRPLTVHYPPSKEKNATLPFLTVCIKPLHFRYDRALWLIEFIEMYKLLGANHFVFYNKSIGETVSRVLRHYADTEHIVSLLPWNLPLRSQSHIRTEGLFAALNDCSYRVMHRFSYAALVDLDEFLIPRKHLNLTKLMAEIDPPRSVLPPRYRVRPEQQTRRVPPGGRNPGAFLFRNAFFYLYWENDTNYLHTPRGHHHQGHRGASPYLLSLAKTRRLAKVHKSGVRSKYIVRPQDVVELGNHVVWEFAPGRSAFTVPEDLALSHHYRICEFGGFECTRQPSVRDRAAHRYAPTLLRKVQDACGTIFPELQGDCPPAAPLGSPW